MSEPPSLPTETASAEIKGLVEYYASVLRRAVVDTFTFTEWTRRTVLMGIALYLLSVFIAAWGSPETILKEIPTLQPWLYGLAIFLGFLLALNIVRAPRLIQQESEIKRQQLSEVNEGLAQQLQPQLDIVFDQNGDGFIDRFPGETPDRRQVVEWKLYRVAVSTRASSSWTRLQVDSVTLKGGRTYAGLFLRVTNRESDKMQTQLYAGVPQLWDVVEKAVGSEWVRLTHSQKSLPQLLLEAPCQFRITASGEQARGISKLVRIDIDKDNNNELRFQLDDVTV